jgi:transposase
MVNKLSSSTKVSELEVFKQCLDSQDHIAVEATGNTRFFYTQIVPFVAECVVVNPSQFEIIKQSFKKTDKNDAEALARFLSKGILPSSRMKEELQAQVNSLVTTRDKLVKLRTTPLNKIHAHLKGEGYES